MAVRKTESRLPAEMQATDLGHAVDGTGVALVSYLTTPIASGRLQTYVLFVTDAALHPQIATYDWTFTVNGTPTTHQTTIGQQTFTPDAEGDLQIDVQAIDADGNAVTSVSLTQQVVSLNQELESLITNTDINAPLAGHPDTSRELINDLRLWIDRQMPPGDSDEGELNRLLLAITYAEALRVPPVQRKTALATMAGLLEAGRVNDLVSEAEEGIGVCQLRPHLLAMVLERNGQPYIPWTLLPAERSRQFVTLTTIYGQFNALSQEDKIDLFNLLRFPKTNVLMCQTILQKLRQQFFEEQSWTDLLANADTAERLLQQFSWGPVAE